MALFTEVEKTFEYLSSSQRLHRLLKDWRGGHTELEPLAHADELIESCGRAVLGDDPIGDAALSALCRQAAGGGRDGAADEDAACTLLWLLLRPLKRRSRDPDVRSALDADEVQAEFAAGLWEATVGVAPGDTRVGRRLINGGRRRARAAARREVDYQLHRRRLRHLAEEPIDPFALVNPEQIVAAALRHGVVNAIEADLVLATRLGTESVADAGRRYGLTTKATYHRRTRAEARLLAWMNGDPIPSRYRARLSSCARSLLKPGVSDPRGPEQHPSHDPIERRWCRGHPTVWPTALPAGPMQHSRRVTRDAHGIS